MLVSALIPPAFVAALLSSTLSAIVARATVRSPVERTPPPPEPPRLALLTIVLFVTYRRPPLWPPL